MGFLDYAGLQHLWDRLKEKFAPKSHNHDDRYYTESEMNSKLGTKASSDHAHGLNSSSLTKTVENAATNSWDMVGGNKDFLLRSLRMQAKAPDWLENNYAAGIAFGGSDTKGVISHAYSSPAIKFAGGNGTAPRWWLRLTGTSGKTYDLNAMPPASHTHTKDQVGLGNVDNTADANKSVKYAATAGTADVANSVDWSKVKNKPSSYTPSAHTHDDRYYTEAEINSKLNGKSNTGHTHDDRYYTESEVNTKLNEKLSLSGGTMTGQIKRDVGCSLIYDRDNAIVYGTSSGTSTGYHPVVGQKTPSGAWTIGTYRDERLIFDYTTDANKTAGTNKATQVYLPAQDGTIITSATIGSQSVNYAKSAGSVAWGDVTGKPGTFTPAAHTHTKSQITDFPASLKNPTALMIQTNGATAATYDGSAAKTVNVTKGNIGLGNVDNTADKNKSVASAAKLTTARTVSGGSDITLSFNYDGSGNSTANIGFYSCKHLVGNTNNYPFHRFAKLDNLTGAYADRTMLVYITQDYNGGGFGICRLSLRTNNSSSASTVEAKWLVRSGLSADFVQVAIYNVYGKTYADAFIKINGTYAGTTVRVLSSGSRATSGRTWTLVDSNEVNGTTATDKKTSSECWKTIAEAGVAIHKQEYSSSASAIDKGYVASAGSANSAAFCTGNSASATKLTSSTGSATQPVYFKDGKPVATTYTLNKTVPADAKFTDTNTWRGIQDNLTSDSTSDSLSAAQGKVLKDLVDGKAPNGHTHNSIKDAGDNRTLTLAYSKDGLAYKSYSWLAGWNGNELRAVDKNQFATAEHGITASGSNYVRFGNGTQICWGQTNSGDATKFVATFPVPFFNTNYSIVVDGIGVRETKTTTSCKFVYVDKTFAKGSYGREWFAIGRWA